MKYITCLMICFILFVSCTKDTNNDEPQLLSVYVEDANFELGAVIACAASEELTNNILTFYYPEPDASNIRYYQTDSLNVDESDFSNYNRVLFDSEPVFNGYLERFVQSSNLERWIMVTFELDDEIKISNPIRTKQNTKPTVWNDIVTIEQPQSSMPNFSWEDNLLGDNAIYFQVLTDVNNNFLSGTYTYENNFKYYILDNVVLNINTQAPPDLIVNNTYNFTLMDVSLDNWVNLVVNKSFIVK